jgi:hypothetical protein
VFYIPQRISKVREKSWTWLVFIYYDSAKGFTGINEKINRGIKDKILKNKNES